MLTCSQKQTSIAGTQVGIGARLCSSDELFAGEARHTGCGGKSDYVWTSDRCHVGGRALGSQARRDPAMAVFQGPERTTFGRARVLLSRLKLENAQWGAQLSVWRCHTQIKHPFRSDSVD